MARPVKLRRVCDLPRRNQFESMGSSSEGLEDVTMTIEEYQTIKLIDLEGLTQEECAKSMEIARTTVQRIYMEARKKLAIFLINGSSLKIEGGNYVLCNEIGPGPGCGRCRGRGLGRGRNMNHQGGGRDL